MPANAAATVQITGPSAFAQSATQSTTLQVAPGTYEVSASAAVTSDPFVGVSYPSVVTGSPAAVSAGATTTVTIDYPSALPGSGLLWVPDYNDSQLVAYDSAQLLDGGTLTADWTLPLGNGQNALAVAFDRSGGLWAIDYLSLYGYTLLGDGGAVGPQVFTLVFEDGGLWSNSLESMTVAPNGDLWLAAYQVPMLARLTPDQLATPGLVVPAQFIPSEPTDAGYDSLTNPYGVAFDSAGNAWVVNGAPANQVIELPRLDDGGYDPNPSTVVFDADGGATGWLNSVAFDAQGDMWVATGYNNSVVHLRVASHSGVQPMAPLAVIGNVPVDDGGAASIGDADYASFDQGGALWVFSQNVGVLSRYDNPGQYIGNVAPWPDGYYVVGYSGDTGKFAFDPAPPGLQLFP